MLRRCCDEAESAQDQQSIVEEELKQCFESYKATWEPAEKMTEVVAAKCLAVVPEQQHKESEFGSRLERPCGHGQ